MYAKLIDGNLQYFEGYIKKDGKVYANPTEEMILGAGYKPLDFSPFPSIDEENETIISSYVELENKIRVTHKVVAIND